MAEIIVVSDRALREIKEIVAREEPAADAGLRVGVVGGGCSGLSYSMDFGTEREHDHVQSHDGFNLFIDPKSAVYLKDTTLDFLDGLNGRGFVFDNPNSRNTCGCGESFAV